LIRLPLSTHPLITQAPLPPATSLKSTPPTSSLDYNIIYMLSYHRISIPILPFPFPFPSAELSDSDTDELLSNIRLGAPRSDAVLVQLLSQWAARGRGRTEAAGAEGAGGRRTRTQQQQQQQQQRAAGAGGERGARGGASVGGNVGAQAAIRGGTAPRGGALSGAAPAPPVGESPGTESAASSSASVLHSPVSPAVCVWP